MTRLVVASLIVGVCFCVPARGAPPVIVAKKPSLVCPRTELGNNDLQTRYTTMWERYSADVDDTSKKLQAEMERQTKSATSSGNLELALFWKNITKAWDETGELRWDEASQKKTWKDRFGGSSFPEDFAVDVKKASEGYAAGRKTLEKGYSALVEEFTKAEELEQAVKVRNELKELLAEKTPAPEPTQAQQAKPEPRLLKNGKYKFVFADTGWGFLLELQDDTLWIHGDVNPNKPGGIAVWPNPRPMPCRVVGGKVLVDDKGSETMQWRCAITWDAQTGEATHLFDNYKGKSFQKRGKITAGAW